MDSVTVLREFGDVGAFALLAVFMIWWMMKTLDRKDKQITAKD